jgi:hypothetical protein
MSEAALARLDAARAALDAALERAAPHEIEAAAAEVAAALSMLDPAALAADPAWRPKLEALVRGFEAAQLRVNFLTDAARRRAERLPAACAAQPPLLYGRAGR